MCVLAECIPVNPTDFLPMCWWDQRSSTTRERKGKTNEREAHGQRFRMCKRCVREEDEGWFVEEERKEVTRLVGITNRMSWRESRERWEAYRIAAVQEGEWFVCVFPRGDGEQARDREEGLERALEAVGERERACYSDFTTLQAPIPLTFYSSLPSPISSMRARHALPLCAYCLPPVPLCTMLN